VSQSKYTVGLVQMAMGETPGDNVRKAMTFVTEAAREGAQVVCLPEMFASQYFCQREDVASFDLAEPLNGPSVSAMQPLAASLHVSIVVPIFERRGPGVYHNSLVMVNEAGAIAGVYRKMHIPDDPAYYEKYYFAPGDLGFKAFDVEAGRIGTLICWDQWYPEGARLTAMQGASILCYPTAIGWHPAEKAQYGAAQRDAWRTVQRGHAVANGIYVAAVNRVGHEVLTTGTPGIEFWGSSFLCDPQGVVLAEASADREEVLVGEIDLAHMEEIRRNWPFFRDRRIDAYGDITKRFLDREAQQ
jgi:N-carbamoylputrescine amidase